MTYETPVGANMFAYCMNNPAIMQDSEGKSAVAVFLAKAAVYATVNVAVTYIAAKVTGQSYSWKDAGVAAVAGATGAIPVYGKYISGAITGVYTAYTNYANGADLFGAFSSGIVAAAATTFSMANLAEILGGAIDISTVVLSEFTFGVGFNISAAVVSKAAVNIGNRTNNYNKTEERNYNVNNPTVRDPYWRTK